MHSSHFLPLVTSLKSIVPMKFGSKEAESPPMGARLPSAPSQGTGPHYREQGPSSCLSTSLPVLKAGGVGTDLRDGSSSKKVPKDPVATNQRLQDHMTQEVIRISLISKWKTQKQGKNRHFGRGQGKAGISTQEVETVLPEDKALPPPPPGPLSRLNPWGREGGLESSCSAPISEL